MDANSPSEQFDQLCRCIASGRKATRQLSAWVSQFDLKEPEFRILWLLRDKSSHLDQSQLAELLASSPAQISALVERLRSRGYLSGEAPPGDRRRCLWTITPIGSELLTKITKHAAGDKHSVIPTILHTWRKSA